MKQHLHCVTEFVFEIVSSSSFACGAFDVDVSCALVGVEPAATLAGEAHRRGWFCRPSSGGEFWAKGGTQFECPHKTPAIVAGAESMADDPFGVYPSWWHNQEKLDGRVSKLEQYSSNLEQRICHLENKLTCAVNRLTEIMEVVSRLAAHAEEAKSPGNNTGASGHVSCASGGAVSTRDESFPEPGRMLGAVSASSAASGSCPTVGDSVGREGSAAHSPVVGSNSGAVNTSRKSGLPGGSADHAVVGVSTVAGHLSSDWAENSGAGTSTEPGAHTVDGVHVDDLPLELNMMRPDGTFPEFVLWARYAEDGTLLHMYPPGVDPNKTDWTPSSSVATPPEDQSDSEHEESWSDKGFPNRAAYELHCREEYRLRNGPWSQREWDAWHEAPCHGRPEDFDEKEPASVPPADHWDELE